MFIAHICIGSNLGDKIKNCIDSLNAISEFSSIKVVSSFYETEPVGNENQPIFINVVAKVNTQLSPYNLLDSLKNIERQMGRTNGKRWSPRIIDLDVLFYENFVIESKDLIIPHKELHKRKFVLKPLYEIDPDLEHPVLQQTVSQLLSDIVDHKEVKDIGRRYKINK